MVVFFAIKSMWLLVMPSSFQQNEAKMVGICTYRGKFHTQILRLYAFQSSIIDQCRPMDQGSELCCHNEHTYMSYKHTPPRSRGHAIVRPSFRPSSGQIKTSVRRLFGRWQTRRRQTMMHRVLYRIKRSDA